MSDVFMQRVGFVISNDTIASTVEKDAENQILLYFVICIVTEHIIVGRSGKACLPGISKIAVIDCFCCIRISCRHYESVLT